eukprot:8179813-Karenia_brevis.AAC.1
MKKATCRNPMCKGVNPHHYHMVPKAVDPSTFAHSSAAWFTTPSSVYQPPQSSIPPSPGHSHSALPPDIQQQLKKAQDMGLKPTIVPLPVQMEIDTPEPPDVSTPVATHLALEEEHALRQKIYQQALKDFPAEHFHTIECKQKLDACAAKLSSRPLVVCQKKCSSLQLDTMNKLDFYKKQKEVLKKSMQTKLEELQKMLKEHEEHMQTEMDKMDSYITQLENIIQDAKQQHQQVTQIQEPAAPNNQGAPSTSKLVQPD